MSKSKKSKNPDRKRPLNLRGIEFELEPNALELMEEHLALFKPPVKDADRKRPSPHPNRVGPGVIEIDLHGLTLEAAERVVTEAIEKGTGSTEAQTFKIITGKGRHSAAGRGILVREIHLFVTQRYGLRILRIEESPDAVRISGKAIRGHFHVTLKGPG